jgi:SNF2 family DNA or RNA helicase
MKFTPRKYQHIALSHLLDYPRASLFADMGLGKTISVLTAFDILRLAGESRRMLVIAPLRVTKSVWPKEVLKWGHTKHLKVSVIIGKPEERLKALKTEADIYCINYENLVWLVEQCKKGWPFDIVVADESTKLKGLRAKGGAQRAKALRKVARCTLRWVNLTGTPAPNGYMDLWGQLWFMDFGERLGATFTAFKDRWFKQDWNGFSYSLCDGAEADIQNKISDICLTLKAKDYFDLKEPIISNITVELPKKAREQYDRFEQEMYAELGEHEIEAFNAAALSNKCSQMANGAVYIDDKQTWKEVHKAKLEALESIINEASGMPVLVSYWFKSDLARLQKAFPKGKALDSSEKTIDNWNKGKIPILFAHPASAGHGLNLQDGGNIIAFFSMTWDLEKYDQIVERIGPVRQLQAGYERPVFIYHILAENTTDQVMLARLKSKRSVQDLLMEAMKR